MSDSPVIGCNSGSVQTSLHTSVRRLAVKSLISLCLIVGNPPLGQESACSTENLAPQPHVDGGAFRSIAAAFCTTAATFHSTAAAPGRCRTVFRSGVHLWATIAKSSAWPGNGAEYTQVHLRNQLSLVLQKVGRS